MYKFNVASFFDQHFTYEFVQCMAKDNACVVSEANPSHSGVGEVAYLHGVPHSLTYYSQK